VDKRKNLVLLGFMGTGKSALGRRLAALTSRPFLDMDAELERRAGRPISRIFAEAGEEAFRRMESQLAAEWGPRDGTVIACGGGVVLREENLRALGQNGVLVCLTARPEVILERTARSKKRPLLAGENPAQKIRDLLAVRAPFYAKIPIQVDTSDLDPDSLADRILDAWAAGN
jgi:shikimate kinase